ncbi:MAG: response regulator [Candidatus Sulfotelmatobacter sp.]
MPDAIALRNTVKWQDFRGAPIDNSLVRILAVDDNDALRYSLVRSLREAGYQVMEAKNGAEALSLVKQLPDLVTLDVNLPDIHGFDVCKQIKSDPLTAHIPVLHLSSTFVDPDARVKGLSSGADAYLAEPIDRAELVATVAALLRLKNAETAARQQAEAAESARAELALLNAKLEERVKERTSELQMANESLRELSIRVLQTQDAERKRIARELHDSAGQLLAAIKMSTASLMSESPGFTPSAAKTIADIDRMTDETLRGIRTISHLLHPPLLDESGLSSALRWYVEEFSERSGIHVELECSPRLPRFSAEIETSIFRIIQECLGNIHRHSESETAVIRLNVEPGAIQLEVQDNGRGIPAARLRELNSGGRGGVGIRGMHERVSQFGGKLSVESKDRGTKIRATVPFKGL